MGEWDREGDGDRDREGDGDRVNGHIITHMKGRCYKHITA